MGVIEKQGKKSRRRRNIQRAVLGAITTAGVVAVAITAPNLFRVIPGIMGKQRYKLMFQARNAIDRLVIKGYLHRTRGNGQAFLTVTNAGRRYLDIESAKERSTAKAKRRWDRRYRLVMFDIPETRKATRERLRHLMRDFGFMKLQNSIWISPYDCEELVALVKAELQIGSAVIYALVDQIEQDRKIKSFFGLK